MGAFKLPITEHRSVAEPSVSLSVKSLCRSMACHFQPLISKLQAKLKHLAVLLLVSFWKTRSLQFSNLDKSLSSILLSSVEIGCMEKTLGGQITHYILLIRKCQKKLHWWNVWGFTAFALWNYLVHLLKYGLSPPPLKCKLCEITGLLRLEHCYISRSLLRVQQIFVEWRDSFIHPFLKYYRGEK